MCHQLSVANAGVSKSAWPGAVDECAAEQRQHVRRHEELAVALDRVIDLRMEIDADVVVRRRLPQKAEAETVTPVVALQAAEAVGFLRQQCAVGRTGEDRAEIDRLLSVALVRCAMMLAPSENSSFIFHDAANVNAGDCSLDFSES